MILLITLTVLNSILTAYTRNVQEVTLYLGRELAAGNELAGNQGFQDAITPKMQTTRNYLMFALLAATVVAAFLVSWVWVPISLVAWVVLSVVARLFMPKDVFYYARGIGQDLARREADYVKSNDH